MEGHGGSVVLRKRWGRWAREEERATIGRRFTWVDVDALPARHRVHTHNGVDRLDGFTPHRLSSGTGAVCLCNRAVHRRQAFQVFLEAGAEGRVEGISVAGPKDSSQLTYSIRGCDRV